ncbi:MAG: acyl-CoA dehydratase activase-related protein [Bacteroidales bacterium]|jgi:predicted CoA-substrate-specific enzyme activase|nr:acyl-CoA dehydratase activase-related protein [Bacteroidales bacterium]
MIPSYSAGIDIGSTTFKLVVVNEKGNIIFSDYRRHNTDIRLAGKEAYKKLYDTIGNCYLNVVMTGSVGMGYADNLGVTFVQEVVASAELIKHKFDDVHTFIDIGGEDSKMIFFEKNKAPDIRMNGNCAGGTGAFIDQTAALLGIDTLELNQLALGATTIYPIASRCGVFAKTDIQNLISRKVSKNDIAISVFNAIAIQVIASLARGSDIKSKIFLCGGPFAFLPELKNAFFRQLKLTDDDIILPENAALIPAWGCAITPVKNSKKILLSASIKTLESNRKNPFEDNMQGRLPALFTSEIELNAWKKEKNQHSVQHIHWDELESLDCYLGVDSGSTTTKIVLIDNKERVVFKDYSRNEGDSYYAFLHGLKKLKAEADAHHKKIRILGSATTGYGENLIQTAFNLHKGIIETIAHFLAAKKILPEVSFILDIGGQDMKAIFIDNGVIKRLEINEACSSGCGSFIESYANMLNYPVAEFAEMSCYAKKPCDLGTRCTVFMNSKVKQAMREGAAVEDIAAGFSYSVVKNCLFKVLKLKDIKELGSHIVVQGGAFRNLSIGKALELLTGADVAFSDIPEMMGAYGAALYAKSDSKETDRVIHIDKLLELQSYTSEIEICTGCENSCTVKKFVFSNGNTYYSGNNCEKIFSNKTESLEKGVNQHQERYKLLFKREVALSIKPSLIIGIPRALSMYEHYPFWHTLLTECNLKPVLSKSSTNRLYEKGIQSIMADNICFPAKLMHGHIMDLIQKKVDRILYPYTIFDTKETSQAHNSYNCPIVAGYSDVIKSAIDAKMNYGIPLDAPTASFKNEKLLFKSCKDYLTSLGIDKKSIKKAFEKALKVQQDYVLTLAVQNKHIVEDAKKNNRMVILLAGRPYHIDPLIQHKIGDAIAEMGIDVITENITLYSDNEVFKEVHSISQWAYPNRVLKAAHYVATTEENIHFVLLTSFGCGPDAFIIDEINDILKRRGKGMTILKIDDVNNIGSLRLRIRSLVESLKFSGGERKIIPFKTLPAFTKEEKNRTILAPYFAESYSELLPALFQIMGYKLINLPPADAEAAEIGLKYANNDICYPATLVVGSIIKAMQSGNYNPNEIAIGITQTGGQCRASNYIALIKTALISAGYDNIPVISVAFGKDMMNEQPGFKLKLRGNISIALFALLYTDCISKLYYASVVREKVKGVAKKLQKKYIDLAMPCILQRSTKGLKKLFKQAISEFDAVIEHKDNIPIIGVVGEIYVKYNSFSHKNVLEWLSSEGVEVVAPSMYNFFINSFVNNHINKKYHIQEIGYPLFVTDTLYKIVYGFAKSFDKIGKSFRYYRPFADIFHDAKLASKIINLSANFGEGWLIPAELASFAENKIYNAVSLQPFGCIANQVISKGIEKKLKKIYPQMNLLFLDFDGGTSEANIFNRLHFMVENAKQSLLKKE